MNFIKANIVRLGLGLVAVVVMVGGAWYYFAKVYVPAFPMAKEDTQISWDFKGAYTGNDSLVAKGNTDIAANQKLLGTGTYDDYVLYLGIGNDYFLLGDGKDAYSSYNKAAHVHVSKGLAYANIGNLMSTLGAYGTARDAYAKAVAVEPGQLEFNLEQLSFLTSHFASDETLVSTAFADAAKQYGDAAPLLVIKAPWLEATGHIAEAIKAWQVAERLSPPSRQAAIEEEIARLTKKLNP